MPRKILIRLIAISPLALGLPLNVATGNEFSTRLSAHIDEKGMPIVEIPLPSGSHMFILDTGSDLALHINHQLIQEMGDHLTQNGTIQTIDAAGRVNELRSFIIKTIEIEGLRFDDLHAAELKPWGVDVSNSPKLSQDDDKMVIGRTFFAGKVVFFDFRAGFIEIIEPAVLEQYIEGYNLTPLRTVENGEGIVLEIASLGAPLNLIVDTASTVSVIRDGSADGAQDARCSEILEGLNDADCDAVSISVGQRTMHAMVIDTDFGGLQADGIIGSNFLLKGKLLIDFPKAAVFIE